MSRRNTHGEKIAFRGHPFAVAETKCRSLCAAWGDNPSTDLVHTIPYNSHRRQIDARTSRAFSVVEADKFAAVSRKRWTRVARSNREFACRA